MPRWWPRPRGQLVRQSPEWFNDRFYQGGVGIGLIGGGSATLSLENTGTAPTLLLVFGLQIIVTGPIPIYFTFQNGAIGNATQAHIAQAPSQAAPSGQVNSQSNTTLAATGPNMFLNQQTWQWPYPYPIATVEPNTSYCLTGFNSGATMTFSAMFWWIEAYQGYNP